MKHILSNPHNGAPVDFDGVVLEPGYEVEVGEREANSLRARFGFLLHRVADGKPSVNAKATKLKGELRFEHFDPSVYNDTTGEAVPLPDAVRHETATPAKKKAK